MLSLSLSIISMPCRLLYTNFINNPIYFSRFFAAEVVVGLEYLHCLGTSVNLGIVYIVLLGNY